LFWESLIFFLTRTACSDEQPDSLGKNVAIETKALKPDLAEEHAGSG
jgi:hypothetical protein